MNDMLFSNVYDSDLNRFTNIRRVGDVYQWGNQVLWPGLLGNSGPFCADSGDARVFRSWAAEGAPEHAKIGVTIGILFGNKR